MFIGDKSRRSREEHTIDEIWYHALIPDWTRRTPGSRSAPAHAPPVLELSQMRRLPRLSGKNFLGHLLVDRRGCLAHSEMKAERVRSASAIHDSTSKTRPRPSHRDHRRVERHRARDGTHGRKARCPAGA